MTRFRRVVACLAYLVVHLVAGRWIEDARYRRGWRQTWEKQGVQL